MTTKTLFAAFAATTVLTACGGSNSATEMTDGPLFAVNDTGETVSLVQAAQARQVLKASGSDVSGVRIDYGTDTTALANQETTFQLTADGGLIVTLDGVETQFTAAELDSDGDGYGRELTDSDGNVNGFLGVFGQNDSLEELIETGERYSGAVQFSSFPQGADGSDVVYAIIGARTRADATPTGEASYYGQFGAESLPSTDFEGYLEDRVRLRGDVTLNVDMNANISGFVDDITVQPAGESDRSALPGQIIMSSSAIADGAFNGNLTADSTLVASPEAGITDANLGSYAGRFYGPTGQEASGTVAMQIQTEDGVDNAYGFFAADVGGNAQSQ